MSALKVPESEWARMTGEIPGGHVCILAVDPGGTTGLCAISVPASTLFEDEAGQREAYAGINLVLYDQLTGDEIDQAQAIVAKRRQLEELSGYHVPLVMESFVLRKFDMGSALLSPVRLLEQVKTLIRVTTDDSVPQVFFQQPDKAKRTVTDARLIRWKLWYGKAGSDRHARDAERHAIYFLRRCAARDAHGITLRNLAFGLAPKDVLAAAAARAGGNLTAGPVKTATKKRRAK